MFPMKEKKIIAPGVTMAKIYAPKIAKKRKPGQFVILRLHEYGERIPLTIVDSDPTEGTITVISQKVGKSTAYFDDMPITQEIIDVVGPLGHPTKIEKYGNVVCIGGGIGIAPIYPIACGMKSAGNHVTSILGGRSKENLILEDMMTATSDATYVTTDDGSYKRKGFVTDMLSELVNNGETFDLAIAIGPVPMMKAVASLTSDLKIPLIVSLNALMVDGTGMCGGCRVSVGDASLFTCVDGPEFDGHKVDYDELMLRQKMFDQQGRVSMQNYLKSMETHECECAKND